MLAMVLTVSARRDPPRGRARDVGEEDGRQTIRPFAILDALGPGDARAVGRDRDAAVGARFLERVEDGIDGGTGRRRRREEDETGEETESSAQFGLVCSSGASGTAAFRTRNVSLTAAASASTIRTPYVPSVVSRAGPMTTGSQTIRPGSPS